jgi:hypothetical protein
MGADPLTGQKSLVQESLFSLARRGSELPTTSVVDDALRQDVLRHGGRVFHGSQTPRASVRRTISELVTDGLVIRDGRGALRIQVSALVDCVVHGDVLSLLRMCPDNALSFVHADPPWSYMQEHTSTGTTTRMVGPSMRWFETPDLPTEVITEIHRVLKPGGVFLCWLPPFQEAAETQWEVLGAIRAAGLRPLREVTWDKGKGPGYGWAPSSEPCFAFFKQRRPAFYDLSVTNLLRHPRLRAEDKTAYTDFTAEDRALYAATIAEHGTDANIPDHVHATLKERAHGCEKPVPMLMDLLRPVLGPGKHGQAPDGDNLVADLYSGSGSLAEAAHRLGAHFCSVEVDERNVEHLIVPRLGHKVRTIIRLDSSGAAAAVAVAAAAPPEVES